MPGTNDFLTIATSGGANVLTQAQYAALASLLQNGYQSGIANSAQMNKTWRQSSIMAAILGTLIADVTGQNVVDDGTTATILSNLMASIMRAGYVDDTGAVNAYVATLSPAILAYYDGFLVGFSTLNANTTTTPTLNVNGLGAITITNPGGGALQVGQIPANTVLWLAYNSTGPRFELQTQSVGSQIQTSATITSVAGGTADAITGSYSPAITTLNAGMTLLVRAASANTTTTPTFTPNSGTIAAKTIVKDSNKALAAGDIDGAGHWLVLTYDATLDKWVLENPSTMMLAALAGATFSGPVVMSDQQLSRAMLIDQGYKVVDKGNISNATVTFDYTGGSIQTYTATGSTITWATSNWPPTGNLGEMLIQGTNMGAFTHSISGITWILPDGTMTTSLATYLAALPNRPALQTSGVDQFLLWSRDAGTTIYGKLI